MSYKTFLLQKYSILENYYYRVTLKDYTQTVIKVEKGLICLSVIHIASFLTLKEKSANGETTTVGTSLCKSGTIVKDHQAV